MYIHLKKNGNLKNVARFMMLTIKSVITVCERVNYYYLSYPRHYV